MTKWQQENQEKEFKKVLNQAWRNSSIENFISTFYKDAIFQEMQGFLLVTKPLIVGSSQIREGVEFPYKSGEALNPYIIFFAAEDVHDFGGIGDQIEYIILKYGEEKDVKFFRVVDDKQDTLVAYENEKITIRNQVFHNVEEEGKPYTPVIQISSITKKLKTDKIKTSPIDHVIPDLFRYMRKDSDLIIQMVRHMYPKLAAVTTACKKCEGEGYYFDDETKIRCADCNGSGKVIPISRDGIIGLPQYIDEGKTPYPGSPASYITPDNASLVTAKDDLKELAIDIMYSATGDKNIIAESLNTATENLINFKGLEDRISDIVEMVESREEFLIKTIALMHNDFRGGFKGVSVKYGRRLTLRGENEIMTEIQSAKTAAMPVSHIESLQRELIYARYKNNPLELERQQLLADVEPFNGYDITELTNIYPYVDQNDLHIKINFSRLIDLFEEKYGPVQLFMPDGKWKVRVNKIYEELKTLKNEVLSISGQSIQN